MARYPVPLKPGDRIGITAPSSGVAPHLMPRFEACLASLREQGYDVVVGRCLDGDDPHQRDEGGAGRRADGHAHRPRDPCGVPAVGRRDRHRPARRPRLGGPGRGRPDLGDRLQRHHHLDAAADAAAGLGDRARRDADGRALPPARRPGPLERPRVRHRSRRPARHRCPSHRGVRGLGRRPRHGGVPPRRHGGVVHARARPGGRHRPADRRLHRDGHQPHRHAVRRSPGVGGPAGGGHDRLPRGLRRRRVHDLPQPARPPAGRLVRPRPGGGDRQHAGAGLRHADPARGGRRRAGDARHPGGARRRDRPRRAAAAAGQRRPRPAGRRRRPARDHPGRSRR